MVTKVLTILLLQFLLIRPSFALMANDISYSRSPLALVGKELNQPFKPTMLSAAGNSILYRIEPGHSKARFYVHGPLGMVQVEFKRFKGGVALSDVNSNQAGTLLSLDVNSLESNSLFAAGLLKSKSLLDADLHPEITFVGKDMVWISSTKAVLKGDLTIHGITRQVAFYVEFSVPKGQYYSRKKISIKASTTISRARFGLVAFSPEVDDKVNLRMQIEAVRYSVEPF